MTRIARGLAVGVAIAVLSVLAPAASAQQVPGIGSHLMWQAVDSADQDRQLDLMKNAGAQMVRVDVGWSSLEQNAKGEYEQWYLEKLDGLVAKAELRDLDLLFTLTDSPCWASSAPESRKQSCQAGWWDREVQRYPPVNAQDYADALAFLVRRYGSRIAAWEIWNEPNIDFYFRSSDQPADYARIVRAAYPAVKAVDPAATVIAGSVAEVPLNFTEQLFEHGIGGYFDAYSIHPYSGDKSPLDPLEPEWIKNSFAAGIPAMRKLLLEHGERKPIWLTEFGWSTSNIRGSEDWRNGVDEETQALFTEQALLKVKEWRYVPVAILYELQDEGPERDLRNSNFGLLRYDGSLKPAYEAFHRGALALADPRPGANPFSIDPDWRPRRLRVWLERNERRAIARGVGEPNQVARVRAYRYRRAHHRFAHRATFKARVTVRASGRFKRRLGKRFKHGRWRLKAKYARSV